MRRRLTGRAAASIAALVVLSACGPGAGPRDDPSAAAPPTTSAQASSVPPTPTTTPSPEPRTTNWFDLDVGACLADPPPVDPSIVTVTVVDCAAPHQAEVYLRAPMAVNTALADVADRACRAGFLDYTGREMSSSPLATTYLIDSNQNRTSGNPDPSTVICLLQSASGEPLLASARR